MNRIERLTATLLLLMDQPRTASEIAHAFEVSKRTVFRDIQALCEMGVPIMTRAGVNGGYALPPTYRVPPLPLTAQEAFLLLLAVDTINHLSDTPFRTARISLLAKLRTLIPHHTATLRARLAVVTVDLPPRTQRAPLLEAIVAATEHQQWLVVTYRSVEHASTQHLLPRRVTSEHGYWYCHAFAFEHGEERIYRIDRIQTLAPAPAQFMQMTPAPTRAYTDPIHPRVLVDLTARGVRYVESDPHLGQQIQRFGDGTGQLDFHCPPHELGWYARYFAGFGNDAHVVAPDALCRQLAQLGHVLREQYGK